MDLEKKYLHHCSAFELITQVNSFSIFKLPEFIIFALIIWIQIHTDFKEHYPQVHFVFLSQLNHVQTSLIELGLICHLCSMHSALNLKKCANLMGSRTDFLNVFRLFFSNESEISKKFIFKYICYCTIFTFFRSLC